MCICTLKTLCSLLRECKKERKVKMLKPSFQKNQIKFASLLMWKYYICRCLHMPFWTDKKARTMSNTDCASQSLFNRQSRFNINLLFFGSCWNVAFGNKTNQVSSYLLPYWLQFSNHLWPLSFLEEPEQNSGCYGTRYHFHFTPLTK